MRYKLRIIRSVTSHAEVSAVVPARWCPCYEAGHSDAARASIPCCESLTLELARH